MSAPSLAVAARVVREALRDKSYRGSPLGLVVGRYIRWKRSEWGARPKTIRDYEAALAALCLEYADLEVSDFEPPVGTERLREFLDGRWGASAPATRSKATSILKDFFKWVVVDARLLHGDPALPLRRPKPRDPERRLLSKHEATLILQACERRRDLIAASLLIDLGLRKGELTAFRLADYQDGSITVHGKGGRIRHIPVVDPVLRLTIEAEREERAGYLLHPEHTRVGRDGHSRVIWADPNKSLGNSAMHNWWARLVQRAGLPHVRMHAARHYAITDLLRATGNLELARKLAGHRSIQTTADIYAHLDTGDLAEGLRRKSSTRREDADS